MLRGGTNPSAFSALDLDDVDSEALPCEHRCPDDSPTSHPAYSTCVLPTPPRLRNPYSRYIRRSLRFASDRIAPEDRDSGICILEQQPTTDDYR